MVFLWFSYGFPMVFLWFSYGFPMVFLCKRLPGRVICCFSRLRASPGPGPSGLRGAELRRTTLQGTQSVPCGRHEGPLALISRWLIIRIFLIITIIIIIIINILMMVDIDNNQKHIPYIVDDYPWIAWWFSIAMLNNQRVVPNIPITFIIYLT